MSARTKRIRVVLLACLALGHQLTRSGILPAADAVADEGRVFYDSLPDGPPVSEYTPYCGIRCVHIAAVSLGQNVLFRSLLSPEFVNWQGSSSQQLLAAAESVGLTARAASRLTYLSLQMAEGPVILHVKPRVESESHSHWILLCAWHENDCLITDGSNSSPQRISAGRLRAIWDGNAIILSKANPPAILPLRLVAILQGSGCILIALVVSEIVRAVYELLCRFARRHRRMAYPVQIVLGASLLAAVAGVAATCSGNCRWIGFCNDAEVIAGLVEYHAPDFLHAVSLSELESLVAHPDGAVIVDARWKNDFDQGCIPGAVNVEPNTKAEDCARQLSGVPLESPIIVYCNLPECPYSREISRRLLAVGYRNVRIFHGGWKKWQSRPSTHPRNV